VCQLQPLRRYFNIQLGRARNVAARSAQAGDEAKPNRIAVSGKDNGNRRGLGFGRQRSGSACGGKHRHWTMNQIGHQRR